MSHNQTVYFLHIPKTAGTSINAWLQSQGKFHICPEGLWSLLLKRDPRELDDYTLFAGHFYTYLDLYLKRNLTTFTFLRHPVERSVSHYRHIMRDSWHYLHKRARRLGDFKKFMRDDATRPMIYNYQTRALSMHFDIVKLSKKRWLFNKSSYPLEQYIESNMKHYQSAIHLPQAMEYLKRCCMVGITEEMNRSMQKLAEALGVPYTGGDIPVLNTAKKSTSAFQLTHEEHSMLMELVADDMALYEYGRSLLHSSL